MDYVSEERFLVADITFYIQLWVARGLLGQVYRNSWVVGEATQDHVSPIAELTQASLSGNVF